MAQKNAPLLGLISAAGLAFGLATAANAQIAWVVESDAQPQRETRSESRNQIMISMQDDGDSVLVDIDNGKATVTINGRRVPNERVKKIGETLQIVDDFGQVQRIIDISMASAPPPPPPPGLPAVAERPRVMLGVTMSEPSEALQRQLNIVQGTVVQIDSVIGGLPADRAGLRQYDLIVGLDGKEGVMREDITKALRAKQPGESMTLTVLRNGERRTIEVRLEAFNAQSLGLEAPAAPGTPGAPLAVIRGVPWFPDAQENESTTTEGLEALRGIVGDRAEVIMESALKAALETLRATEDRLPGNVKREIAEAKSELERAMREIESLRSQQQQRLRSFTFGGGQNFVLDNNRLIRVPSTPAAPRAFPESGEAERLEQLSQRLDVLDARLTRFERSMDRFEQLVERMERRP